MTDGKALINLGELSKPASILVERISDAVGGIFRPFQTRRVAKAEADAEIIRAETQIEITAIHQRAFRRFLNEEARRQENIEDITQQALSSVAASAKPEDVEEDWITNFFEKARIISDVEMQALWSKVLAGEANTPGRFSKRTVNLLGDLDKSDAELFTALCRFTWNLNGLTPLIFNTEEDIYNREGISFGTVEHLASLGLVRHGGIAGYQRKGLPETFFVSYFGRPLHLVTSHQHDPGVLTRMTSPPRGLG